MESLGDILKRAHMARPANLEPSVPPPPVCPVCLGAGYLRYDVTVEDPRFGELVVCECTRRTIEQKRRERLIERSNLGALRDLTFERFVRKVRNGTPPRHSPDAALLAARAYAESNDPRPWLVLHGAFGTGKTHLAAAIANYRLVRGEAVVFIVVPDLLDHLRSTFSPASEVTYDEQFETVRDVPLLILDDLGTQTSTPWAQEKLYQIINHRYNHGLAMVVTTNLSPDTIEPRLRSRLGDGRISQMVQIVDVDKRLGVTHAAPSPAAARRPARRVREDDRP